MAPKFWDKITSKFKGERDGEQDGATASPIQPTTPSKSIAETSASSGDASQPAQTTYILTSTEPGPHNQPTPFTAHSVSSAQRPATTGAVAPPPLSTPTASPQPVPSDTVASAPPSLPGRLWNQAYDDLKAEESKLVDAYERLLSCGFSEGDLSSKDSKPQENEIEQTNSEKRRAQMIRLVQAGLKKTEKEAAVKQGIDDGMQAAVPVKQLIDTAIQAAPQAAVAWAGVCFILQILANPISETVINRGGIAYVVSRMDWYWNLSSLLLEENRAERSPAGLRDELEKHVIDLYKALLSYQIKSICSYYRNRRIVFLRDMIRLDDWDGNLKTVQDAEDIVRQDSAVYNTQEIRSYLGELVNIAKSKELKLHDIHRAIQDQAAQQREMREKEEDKKCLKDLRLTDPRDDKKRIEETKGGLLKDSYKWILNNPDFRRWRDNDQSRLLWIKGDPGKGKTMLLIGITNELGQQLRSNQSTTEPGILSYFFCQGTDSRLNNATAVLRGLIYLLIEQEPSLISHVRKKHDHAGQQLFEDANAFVALSEIFGDMLQDPTLTRAYIIIDALDECETGLQQLLGVVQNASVSPRVKWIVSSRNKYEIEQQLSLNDSRTRLSLELKHNAEHVSHVVDLYIDDKVSRLALLQYNCAVQDQVRDLLRRKANGTFLWVALVFNELETVESWDVLQVVEEIPTGLENLYSRTIQQIQQRQRKDPELCRLVLSAATLAHRPLHLVEIGVLSGLPKEISSMKKNVERIVGMCGSFLTVLDEHVYLIHQSAKDYLSEKARDVIFPSGPGRAHHAIFSRSLQAMHETLQRDIYKLYHPGLPIDEVNIPDPDPLVAVRYSCVYWVDHLCEACSYSQYQSDLNDGGIVYRFLQMGFLYWLEALSLLQNMSEGVLSITRLESLLREQSVERPLLDLVQDARRFILHNKSGIENAPLQTFEREEPKWMVTKPILESNWSLCLQALEGHDGWIWSVAFSGDSKLVASGSGDKTVKIWDATTGKEVQTLRTSTILTNISFDTTCLHLFTEIGSIKLSSNTNSYVYTDDETQAQAQKIRSYGYGLNSNKSWITWNEHNILWLPPDYRPSSWAVSSSSSLMIAIGCRSGRVLTIGFSEPPRSWF